MLSSSEYEARNQSTREFKRFAILSHQDINKKTHEFIADRHSDSPAEIASIVLAAADACTALEKLQEKLDLLTAKDKEGVK